MAKQLSFLPKVIKSHGGSLAIGKRRIARPLNPKQSHHITLKSLHAVGGRCLFKHKKMIKFVMKKASLQFDVKVYEHAICSNHIHLIIKGKDRESIQNFFRVFAGHTAQNILKLCPLPQDREGRGGALAQSAGGASLSVDSATTTSAQSTHLKPRGCRKNQRKFWSYLIYSRIVSWGREFKVVARYIQKNTLEALNLIAYQPRGKGLQTKTAQKIQLDTS